MNGDVSSLLSEPASGDLRHGEGARPLAFISYPHENLGTARACARLLAGHFQTFVCQDDLEGVEAMNESEHRSELSTRLHTSISLFVIYDHSHAASAWCGWEVREFARLHPDAQVHVIACDDTPWLHPVSHNRVAGLPNNINAILAAPQQNASERRDVAWWCVFVDPLAWSRSLDLSDPLVPLFGRYVAADLDPTIESRSRATVLSSIARWSLGLLALALSATVIAWTIGPAAVVRNLWLSFGLSLAGLLTIASLQGLASAIPAATYGMIAGTATAFVSAGVGHSSGDWTGAVAGSFLLGCAAIYRGWLAPARSWKWPLLKYVAGPAASGALLAMLMLRLGFSVKSWTLQLAIWSYGARGLAGLVVGLSVGMPAAFAAWRRLKFVRRDRNSNVRGLLGWSVTIVASFAGIGAISAVMVRDYPEHPAYGLSVGLLGGLVAGACYALPSALAPRRLAGPGEPLLGVAVALFCLFSLRLGLSEDTPLLSWLGLKFGAFEQRLRTIMTVTPWLIATAAGLAWIVLTTYRLKMVRPREQDPRERGLAGPLLGSGALHVAASSLAFCSLSPGAPGHALQPLPEVPPTGVSLLEFTVEPGEGLSDPPPTAPQPVVPEAEPESVEPGSPEIADPGESDLQPIPLTPESLPADKHTEPGHPEAAAPKESDLPLIPLTPESPVPTKGQNETPKRPSPRRKPRMLVEALEMLADTRATRRDKVIAELSPELQNSLEHVRCIVNAQTCARDKGAAAGLGRPLGRSWLKVPNSTSVRVTIPPGYELVLTTTITASNPIHVQFTTAAPPGAPSTQSITVSGNGTHRHTWAAAWYERTVSAVITSRGDKQVQFQAKGAEFDSDTQAHSRHEDDNDADYDEPHLKAVMVDQSKQLIDNRATELRREWESRPARERRLGEPLFATQPR